MKKKIIFLDGDGTIWYPKKSKRDEKPHLIYQYINTKNNYLDYLELTPRIKETLEKFKSLGILLVVISANPNQEKIAIAEIKEKLEYFGIINLFHSARSSLGSDPKGKSLVMMDVLNKLNFKREDALMIGDSFYYDYMAAKDIGIDAFWIKNTVCKVPEIMPTDIKSIKEVYDLLNILA